MNRSTHTCTAKLTQPKKGSVFHSYIRFQGKVYRKSTQTRNRQAALDFNLIHLQQIIRDSRRK